MYHYLEYIESYNANRQLYGKVPLLKKIWLVIVVFLYLYNFPMNNFGVPFSSAKLVTVFSLANICFNPAYIPQLFTNRYYRYLNGVIFGLLIYILFFSFFVHGVFTGGYIYPYIIILFFVECFLGGFYIIKTMSNYNIRELLNMLIVAVVLQACIMIIAIVYAPLRTFVLDTLKGWGQNMGNDLNLTAMKFRGLALASDRKLGIAVLNGIVCNVIIYLALTLKKQKVLPYIFYGIAFILTFISGMLAARTFYIVFAFLFVFVTVPSGKSVFKIFKFLFFSILLVLTLGAGILSSVADKETMEKVEAFADWTFEAYNKYEETGEVKTGSSDDLLDNHWQYLPQDTYSWWFGGADRSVREGNVVVLVEFTDSGYLIMLYYVGIIGCLAIYTFWPLIAWKANKLFLRKERMGRLIVAIVLLFYILEIKYQAVLGSYTVVKFMLLLYIFGVERREFFKNIYMREHLQEQAGKDDPALLLS